MSDRKEKMKALLVGLSIVIWLQGCCAMQRTEPAYPKNVVGWRDYKEGTTWLRGNFFLRRGERTENGKLEIKVLDLIPPECTGDAGNYAERARVKLEFTRLSDQKVLCSETFPENGGRSLTGLCADIPKEFSILDVSVRAINLKDGWVFFDLTAGSLNEK